jgi:hypothetical protein
VIARADLPLLLQLAEQGRQGLLAPVDLDDPLGQLLLQEVALLHQAHGPAVFFDRVVVLAGGLQYLADAGRHFDPPRRIRLEPVLRHPQDRDRLVELLVLAERVGQVELDLHVGRVERDVLVEVAAGAGQVVLVERDGGEGAEELLLLLLVAGPGQGPVVGGARLVELAAGPVEVAERDGEGGVVRPLGGRLLVVGQRLVALALAEVEVAEHHQHREVVGPLGQLLLVLGDELGDRPVLAVQAAQLVERALVAGVPGEDGLVLADHPLVEGVALDVPVVLGARHRRGGDCQGGGERRERNQSSHMALRPEA